MDILLEKRWVDASIRLEINEHTVEKWKKMDGFKNEIEKETKIDLEEILGLKS